MFWPVVLVCVLAYVAWRWLHSGAPNPLDSLPGPQQLPLIGNVHTFLGFTAEQMFLRIRKYNQTFGNRFVVKIINRRILHLNHPHDIEIVLNHSKNIKKSKPYRFLEPWLGTGLLLSSGSKWHRRRKILTPTFHFNILKHFSVIIEEKSRKLTATLQKGAGGDDNNKEHNVVDVMPLISTFTLNTICETAMGTQLDVDKSNAAAEYKSAVLKMGTSLLERLSRVWLHSDFIFYNTSRGKSYRKYLQTVHSFPDKVIKERKKEMQQTDKEESALDLEGDAFGGKKRLAMLDLLLVAEKKGEIDLEGIREEVNTFMFEGHDTTAMAIMFAIMLLAENPEVQEKIYDECTSIFNGSDRPTDLNDLSQMKYVEAVIKETLRLYPSVPFIARQVTEEFTLGDLHVPAGSEVAVHIFDMHRRADLYEDPLKFNPDRFLHGSPNKHPFAYVPFSAGPRNCIGQRFAMQEMKCVVSEILRSFTLQPVEGSRPSQVQLVSDLVLRPTAPIYVKFVPRKL